jgi:ubiquitin C-terminal hydrolase
LAYPHFLIIQLHRFEDTNYGKVKLNTRIEINQELDLSSYYMPILSEINNPEYTTGQNDTNTQTMRYDLIGIVHHRGDLTSGHYWR